MYERTLKMKHHEVPAILDKKTGEVKEVIFRDGDSDNKQVVFDLMERFQRTNTYAWAILKTQVNEEELSIAFKLSMIAEPYTNSLSPLHEDTTATLLANELSTNRKKIKATIDKLFKLGVIGKFEVYEEHEKHKKYWIFNPYLSFNGKYIDKGLKGLFSNTVYGKVSD